MWRCNPWQHLIIFVERNLVGGWFTINTWCTVFTVSPGYTVYIHRHPVICWPNICCVWITCSYFYRDCNNYWRWIYCCVERRWLYLRWGLKTDIAEFDIGQFLSFLTQRMSNSETACLFMSCRSCSVSARETPAATAVNVAVRSTIKFHGSRAHTLKRSSAKVYLPYSHLFIVIVLISSEPTFRFLGGSPSKKSG